MGMPIGDVSDRYRVMGKIIAIAIAIEVRCHT
jgi:hypothetical protein